MTCVLKSGAVIKDSLKIDKKDFKWVNELKQQIETSSEKNPGDPRRMTSFTFAYTTVVFDEVAAVKIQ
jgi:hypothetical protein